MNCSVMPQVTSKKEKYNFECKLGQCKVRGVRVEELDPVKEVYRNIKKLMSTYKVNVKPATAVKNPDTLGMTVGL